MAASQFGNNNGIISRIASLWRDGGIWIRIAAIVTGIALFFVISYLRQPVTQSPNKLVAAGAYTGPARVRVPIVEFPGANPGRAEIESERMQMVEKSSLSAAPADYKPFDPIFAGIDPSRNWISVAQLYYFGADDVPPGIPEKFQAPAALLSLQNPFILVQPEFWGLSPWGPGKLQWNRPAAPLTELQSKDVPLAPRVPTLTFIPAEHRAEALYDISGFFNETNSYLLSPEKVENISFALSLQNARDFGFTHYYLDLGRSEGIANAKQPSEPTENSDYFGAVQTSWGRQELMNHLSANQPLYDWITVTNLPARARIKLWDHKPKEISESADYIYEILLQ